MADLTHLDSQSLTRFRENDLAEFNKNLGDIRHDDADVLSLRSVLAGLLITGDVSGAISNPLILGLLAVDDSVFGQTFSSKITDAAKSVDEIFVSQKTLFNDIDKNLEETTKELLKSQGQGLESVDNAKFLEIFSDVNSDLSDGSNRPIAPGSGTDSTVLDDAK